MDLHAHALRTNETKLQKNLLQIIPSLPFVHYGSTTQDRDQYNYDCSAHGDTGDAPDAVFLFRPSESARVVVATCGSQYDTKLFVMHNVSEEAQVRVPSCTARLSCLEQLFSSPFLCMNPKVGDAIVSCNDDFDAPGCETQSLIQVDMLAGIPYAIVVDGWGGAHGFYVLRAHAMDGSSIMGLPLLPA